MIRITVFSWVVLLLLSAASTLGAESDLDVRQIEVISETARLYMESTSGYVAGDLITESQVDELQQYLRKSLGNSPATHRGLLHQTMKDIAPLSRFFYREDGNTILRSASTKLGGYAALEALSLDHEGREMIQKAIADQSAAEIVSFAEQDQHNSTKASESEKRKDSSRHRTTIYTLDDFLEVAFSKIEGESTPATEKSAR